MAIGIVYYSRTGNTRKIAVLLGEKIKAKGHVVEFVEIEAERRPGFFAAGRASMKQEELPIKNESVDLSKYECVVMGVPVWAGNPSPMLKSFLGKISGSQGIPAACFLNGGGKAGTHDRAISSIRELVVGKGFSLREPVLEVQMGPSGIRSQSTSVDEFLATVLASKK
jgi:flavodoxin